MKLVSQIVKLDDIIEDLHNMGLIKKIGETKILMNLEGKRETEKST